jgi:hypothetical protein
VHLIQLLLPLQDNQGKPFDRALFLQIRDELMKKFGGLTAYSRAPAEGLWKPDAQPTNKEEIVVYEVMAESLDQAWWSDYRRRLEARLCQEQVVIRASDFVLL